MGDRIGRVNSTIVQLLSGILLKSVSPLNQISLTEAQTSKDLSVCKIFWRLVPFSDHNVSDAEEALQHYMNRLRYELSQSIKIRRTPRLIFKFDALIDDVDRLERLIQEAKQKI